MLSVIEIKKICAAMLWFFDDFNEDHNMAALLRRDIEARLMTREFLHALCNETVAVVDGSIVWWRIADASPEATARAYIDARGL